ncbi:MAG: hypothetical protein ACREJN_19445 [Nitrospiraceae bacterium]
MTGGARYSPGLSREEKLELLKGPRPQTVAAGIPEGFRPAKPELVDPQFRASNDINVPSTLAHSLPGMRPDDLPLRGTFSPAHLLAH